MGYVNPLEGISRVGLGLGGTLVGEESPEPLDPTKAATSGASALDATLPFDELALVTENVGWPTEEKSKHLKLHPPEDEHKRT